MHTGTIMGHIVLALEVAAGLWLSHRSIVGRIKSIHIELNGNGKHAKERLEELSKDNKAE